MNITYRHQVYEVDPCTLIVRESGFYARIQVAGRVPMVAYVKVDPRLTGMTYDQPQPCQSITLWRPTIELPIWELGYYRAGSKQKAIPGVNLTMCNVRIVLTLPEAKVA